MKLRVATIADRKALDHVLSASYRELLAPSYAPAVLDAALPYMSRANPALLESGTYFLVELDGAVAGCGGWTVEEPGTGKRAPGVGHIRHFATHPSFTGKGIGRRIADRCVMEAKANDIHSLHAYSTLAAEGFYQSLGFVRKREFDVDFPGGTTLPCVQMIREL